jgi:type II secretory ATPase GspE/PulE/Tfp pilus assembly ATPase PilB-like protein
MKWNKTVFDTKTKLIMKDFLSTTSQDLARTLSEQNRAIEERETQRQADSLQMQYINLQSFPLDLNVLSLMSEADSKASESLPFYKDTHDLRIATTNPENALLKQKIKEFSDKFSVTVYFVSSSSYAETFRLYKKVLVPKSQFQEVIHTTAGDDYAAKLKELADPKVQATRSATELISTLFGAALQLGASDIHIEPESHVVKARFRIDGVLQDMIHFESAQKQSLTTRIKVLSKLKLNVTNEAQDGRFTFYSDEKTIDVRVSVLPSSYGEAVVMRLLGVGATNLKLDQLGLIGRAYKVIEHELSKPNGMIITTGPTGSGKTTTLYAFLNELNEPGVKIITLEDPVEYKLEGIQQTPIDYRVDFSFVKGLRAILRQDPDIVMVGEIRDPETAETALQAALTGHIVLSTLHTNDAAGAVPRLITMGVKPFVIAPAVNAIIAQRLVRKLCPSCKKPATIQAGVIERVEKILQDISKAADVTLPKKLTWYHAEGCQECHGLGYKGRIGIYEVIEVNDTIRTMIMENASGVEIKKQAHGDGTVTMVQDGLLKALEGITDIEEVFRVAGDE